MKTRIFVAVGILALIGLGVAWFTSTFERVTVKERVGASGEARLRPFLAAERFAERMGFKVAELRSLPALDALPVWGVLLMPSQRQELGAARLADLLRWVEKGGHLIVEAEPLGVPDPLLDRLGVARSKAEPLKKPFRADGLNIYFADAMQVGLARGAVRLRAGDRLISFAHGAGTVTAATSLRFARNPGDEARYAKVRPLASIGAHDHAGLLWRVLSLTSGSELRVYFRPARLSLWRFLTEHAAPALAAGGLALALWLWSIAPRFGPVAPDAPPGRRRLLDHLRASGRYYWVKGLRARLVIAARDAALRRVAAAQPDFATASRAEQVNRLGLIMNASKEEAERFIAAGGTMRGAEFIKLAQHAQRVHSALEKGANREK